MTSGRDVRGLPRNGGKQTSQPAGLPGDGDRAYRRDVASTPSPSPVSIAVQFVLTGIVWGSSFLFIAVALTGLTPAQVAGGRLLFGALALGAIVLLRRERMPRSPRVWGHLCVIGATFCVLPYLLFAWAQQYVPSGLASIFNATTPIMTAIMAWAAFRVERLRPGRMGGPDVIRPEGLGNGQQRDFLHGASRSRTRRCGPVCQ